MTGRAPLRPAVSSCVDDVNQGIKPPVSMGYRFFGTSLSLCQSREGVGNCRETFREAPLICGETVLNRDEGISERGEAALVTLILLPHLSPRSQPGPDHKLGNPFKTVDAAVCYGLGLFES